MRWLILNLVALTLVGCQSASPRLPVPAPAPIPMPETTAVEEPSPVPDESALMPVSLVSASEDIDTPGPIDPPTLDMLANSVRWHYPVIVQAVAARSLASGEVLAASGSFDHKLEGYSNSQPLDFYKNYRQSLGVKRDTLWGGEVFGGYRIGRGVFEPWYLERETNKGGEFKAGFVVPLAKDRSIDSNRAELWRSQLERNRVEPEIRSVIIGAIREASIAYWQWVASAANHQIAKDVLKLADDRRGYLERQVELGEKAQIDLVDNQRIILSRSAKVTDARRKLEQSAVKLSLYLRDADGNPVVLPIQAARTTFPQALPATAWGEQANILIAQSNRPELEELEFLRRQLSVLLQQASNETLPQIDAGVLVAQDVGEPTSSKRDKSELKLEATMMLSVPLERRKALGKARQLRAKISQLRAKTQFASEKIASEAQVSHAALKAAAERVDLTTESFSLARQMQQAERRLYELGQSTLFNLNLREKQTADAAVEQVIAQYDYHIALADYAAALGFESVNQLTPVDTDGE